MSETATNNTTPVPKETIVPTLGVDAYCPFDADDAFFRQVDVSRQAEAIANGRPAPCVCGSNDWACGGKLGAHCCRCDRDLVFQK